MCKLVYVALSRLYAKCHINILKFKEKFLNFALSPIYYREADAVILVYDVTNHHSFLNLRYWIEGMDKFIERDTPIFIVGNKIDSNAYDISTDDDARKFAEIHNYKFMTVSAKSGIRIEELFMSLSTEIAEKNSKRERIDQFKVIFLGDLNVGKTSILYRFVYRTKPFEMTRNETMTDIFTMTF